MKAKVELSHRAQLDIDAIYRFIYQDAPGRAKRWRQRMLEAVDTLEYFPLRYGLAPEAEAAGVEVRQMMFGVYPVLYVVGGDMVRVLTVRHGARQFIEPGELRRDD